MNADRTRVAPTVAARRPPLTISGDLVIAVVIVAAAPMFGFWIGHGGLQQFATAAGAATAVGQLTALAGTYLALVQLVLMSRSPWLDRTFGMDRLAVWHRWLGFATVWLLVAHGVFTTIGFAAASDTSIVAEAWAMVTTYPFVLMAVASLGLFILVAVSSVRWARRRLSYETWYGLHLYAYLAIVLGSAHQLVVGTRFHGRRARTRLLDPVVRGRHPDPRVPGRASRSRPRCTTACALRTSLPKGRASSRSTSRDETSSSSRRMRASTSSGDF